MRTVTATKALIALGHESRLAIFKLLTTKGKDGMPAGDIGKHFDIPGATLSFHLAQLSGAKLIDSRKEGRTVFYFVKFKKLKKLIKYLTDNCYNNKKLFESEIESIPDDEKLNREETTNKNFIDRIG